MLPYDEGDEKPEIPPILTDPWDSGYDQNEITDASDMSEVETEPEGLDLEPEEPSKLSGFKR